MTVSVVRPTLLYISSEAVIPAPAFAGVNLSPRRRGAGVQIASGPEGPLAERENTGFPRIEYGAGSVKPGMTIKVKGLLTQDITIVWNVKTVLIPNELNVLNDQNDLNIISIEPLFLVVGMVPAFSTPLPLGEW
jgi:hypothetical protein